MTWIQSQWLEPKQPLGGEKWLASLAGLPPAPAGKTGWPWTVETVPPAHAERTSWPRISIVTPSYEEGPRIEECMRSVLLQNYPNLEYIVMDGGSQDGSAVTINQYRPYLQYSQSQRDAGPGEAINLGFSRASGEILAWINSDDLLLPGALFAVARKFLRGRPEIVYGDALISYDDERALQYWQASWIHPHFLRFGGLIAPHATFWRRSIHVPLWPELTCEIDVELWQRLVPGRKVNYLPLPLGVQRVRADPKGETDVLREKARKDDERIWTRHGRPSSNPFVRGWFSVSQRIFKIINGLRNRKGKRTVVEACRWPDRTWKGAAP